MTRRIAWSLALALLAVPASAQPTFVNGLTLPGGMLDATRRPGANEGRFGFFSDIYYDSVREEWWALADRGPGGGLISYDTRLSRFTIRVNSTTGQISGFEVKETVKFTDPHGLLVQSAFDPDKNLNGLNPRDFNGSASILGRSFDPEGLVVVPHTGHFIVADEYGPSVYEFDRKGRLVRVFETPANLIPKVGATVNYNATRDDGATAGRQDNRGFEGLAISPDGRTIYGVLQDPLVDDAPPADNNGRNRRTLRIIVFDNNKHNATYGKSIAQYAYQLELQLDVRNRILAAGGLATATDPRQGRNIGLSAILALNSHEFLVLERDNRGIGIDDPTGGNVVGSKRVYKIDINGATNVAALNLPDNDDLTAAGITPVTKSAVFLNIQANTVLPNQKQIEKWEGLAVGPRLRNGARLLLVGNDNDFSVTQTGAGTQYDVYVNFLGSSVQRDLDQPTKLNGLVVGAPPAEYVLLPGVLHAYRASASDLAGYVEPHENDDDDDDDGDEHEDRDN
ncbi:MAG: esterase-like activity of phytase family protein [Vicinamibacterales bacterium]